MKFLNIKIFIFLFFNATFMVSQSEYNGIVNYESRINGIKAADYLSNKRDKIKNKQLVAPMDKVFLNTKSVKSTLLFTKGTGIFLVENKMNIPKNDLAQRMSRIDAGGSKEYYYNDITKTYLIKECEALGECFIFENKYLNWELTQETKEINGYIVYKATRSNGKVIAWYTPSIPISFGPKGEYGLPGLILQLEIGNIVFSAVKIVLNPKEEIKIEIPKGGKRISGEEYSEMINKAKKSVFGN